MYFPRLYPYEMDYSYVSRLFLYSGYYGQKTFMKIYCERRTPSVRFITPLKGSAMEQDSRIIDAVYIERHTLYSKYRYIIGEKNAMDIFQRMLLGAPDVDLMAKIPATDRYSSNLCYCPKCAEYQRRQYGEAVWDVRVQCGRICQLHKIPVVLTDIPLMPSRNLSLITAEEVISQN